MKIIRLVGRYILILLLLVVRPIIRRIRWKVIIAVNAGTQADIASYSFGWLAHQFRIGKFYAIGFYKISLFKYGLVLAAPYDNTELKHDASIMRALINDISAWRADRYTLTGIMTAYAIRHEVYPADNKKFVIGGYGTPYMLKINAEEIFIRHPELKDRPIAVVGFGYTGKKVAEYLVKQGFEVTGFDLIVPDTPPEYCKVYTEEGFSKIAGHGLIILLTIEGDSGIRSIKPYISQGSAILADTHPKVHLSTWKDISLNNINAYECGTRYGKGVFFPKLPKWGKYNLQGCVMQSVIESVENKYTSSQLDFDILASASILISSIEKPMDRLKKVY